MDMKIDIKKVKTLPMRFKVLGIIILWDILFSGIVYFIVDSAMATRIGQVSQLRAEFKQVKDEDVKLRKEADAYPQLLQRYNDALATGMADKLDRVKLIEASQDAADRYHLSGLHYRVGAESGKGDKGAKLQTETTRISFDGGGLLDIDAMAFWNELRSGGPGHVQVVELTLERVHEVDKEALNGIRSGAPVRLVSAHYELLWTSYQPTGQQEH